jgi:hypothetical protein
MPAQAVRGVESDFQSASIAAFAAAGTASFR